VLRRRRREQTLPEHDNQPPHEERTMSDYEAPSFRPVGKLHDLTKQGGGNQVDVPQGTPNPNNDINAITGQQPPPAGLS
jgi:hypothetical protein